MFPNFRVFFVALLGAVLLSGCTKDELDEESFELYAEKYTPDDSAKLAVRDGNTYWVDGDAIWVNGGTYRVKITNPDGSSATTTTTSSDWRKFKKGYVCVIYPFSAYVGPEVSSSTDKRKFEVRVPSEYNCYYSSRASGSKQILEGLPMVAYGNSNTPSSLYFKHITAAITVRVKNGIAGGATIVERIELINSAYKLQGDVQVTFSTGDPVIKTLDGASTYPIYQGTPDTVAINFLGAKPRITDYQDFQIPILPVGNTASAFTVKVHYKGLDENGVRGRAGVMYKSIPYVRSTNNHNNSIGRAQLGYAITQTTDANLEPLFEGTTTSVTLEDGTIISGNFYQIKTDEDVITLSEALDEKEDPWMGADGKLFQQSNYIVVNDIDMGGQKMVPIHYYNLNGTETCCFNGDNHTISNYTINSYNQNEPNSCGFFGRSGGGNIVIANLKLDNATYEFSHVNDKADRLVSTDANPCSAVGGIFAVVDDPGIVIENCQVTNIKMGAIVDQASKKQTDFYASGIVGLATEGVTIRNCTVGKVTVDNTNDASSGLVVDQFGAAIGRVDVTDAIKVIEIKDFTYNQTSDPLVFVNGLKNVRYGGVVANITRGCNLYMKNCRVTHKVVLNTKKKDDGDGKADNLYLGGLIGSMKGDTEMKAYMDNDCEVHGTIENNSLADYTVGKYEINRYISGDRKSNVKNMGGAGSVVSLTNNDLTVTTTSGKNTSFTEPSQTLFSSGAKAHSPTPPKVNGNTKLGR